MPALYQRPYGDSALRSFIDAKSSASGKLVWSKRIRPVNEGNSETSLLLTDGKLVIANCIRDLVAFDANGSRKWSRPKWYGSHVTLRDRKIYFSSVERNDVMEAVDLNNQPVLMDFRIPGIFGSACLVLFEPFENSLIGQAQDPGDPHNLPRNFIVYKIAHDSISYDWCQAHEPGESLIMPLVNWNNRKVLTSVYDDALVYDIDSTQREATPLVRFPLPMGINTACVSGDDAHLYWGGYIDTNLMVITTDYSGSEQSRLLIAEAAQPYIVPIAPVIIGDGCQWLITQADVTCMSNGRIRWRYLPEQTSFRSATALADNSLLIACANGLLKLDNLGEQEFHIEFEEALVSPPIINEQGRIFVASQEAIYAFD